MPDIGFSSDSDYDAAYARSERTRLQGLKKDWSRQTADIAKLLPSYVSYNPSATNWYLGLDPRTAKQTLGSLANLPNTVVVDAHGAPSRAYASDKGGGLASVPGGFSPDVSLTNSPADLVRRRQLLVDQNFFDLADHIAKHGGAADGISLAEVAKAIGSQTNEVKRAVIFACYRAGYSPDEIRRHFPGSEQVIAGQSESKTSARAAEAMFSRSPGDHPWGSPPLKLAQGWGLYSYLPASTNLISSASDWADTNAPWMAPLLVPQPDVSSLSPPGDNGSGQFPGP